MSELEPIYKRRKSNLDSQLLGMGKLPPQACDIETLVLGGVLLQKNAIEEIINDLSQDAFYKDAHQKIFIACKNLHSRHDPIDIVTVAEELKRLGQLDEVGGAYFLTTLTERLGSSEYIKYHAKIINEKFARREMIRISGQTMRDAYDDSFDAAELYERNDKEFQEMRDKVAGNTKGMEWADQLQETVSVIEKLYRSELKVSGIPTGNHKLDKVTGGWQKSDLIIAAGRPGSGKTTRALNFIKSACLYGHKTVMFSLEMSYRQIARKFINEQSEVYGNKLVTGEMDSWQLEKVIDSKTKLAELPFFLNDKGGITPNYIRSVLKQRKKKFGVDFVIIDYVQLMKPNDSQKGRSRDSEVGSISTAIKNLAKEFDVPIILLAQLNRKCEERIDKRPVLSDLRESGSLENDADMVIGLYRPSYYYELAKDKEYCKNEFLTQDSYEKISELLILKHRNGQTERKIKENFFGELSRFSEMENEFTT